MCSGLAMNTAAAKEVNEVQKIRNLFAEFPRREEGQTMAEYGVVLAVITIAVFGALALLSGNIVSAVEPRRRLHHVIDESESFTAPWRGERVAARPAPRATALF